jgi:hypothetical protein
MALPRMLAVTCALPAVACVLHAGCVANKPATTQPAATQAADMQMADMNSRLQQIQMQVANLDGISQQLPGDTDKENRQMVASYFEGVAKVLPQIVGESPSSEFRQGLRVLSSSHDQLASGSADMTSEPTIVQGVRSTERLLRNVNTIIFDSDAQITKNLDALLQKLSAMDRVHGPMNRVIVAQALRGSTMILKQMSVAMSERAGVYGQANGGPATRPAAIPADLSPNRR